MPTTPGRKNGSPKLERDTSGAAPESAQKVRAHRLAGLPILHTLPDFDDVPTRPSGSGHPGGPPPKGVPHGSRPDVPHGGSGARAQRGHPAPPVVDAGDHPPRIAGRYVIGAVIGAGGLATVHIGRDMGAGGRIVAIKRLHPQLAREADVAATMLDEGRIVARISHPKVVSLFDTVIEATDIFLVLEYVRGESLSRVMRVARDAQVRIPPAIACRIARDMLRGLHAAHEATDERGRPLGVVHRDVSPHNVLLGADGRSRLLDFGLAKAAGQCHTTSPGQIKGKLSYMAPEHLRGGLVTRRSDLYSASIVLWEMLTLDRPFGDPKDPDTALVELLSRETLAPSTRAPEIAEELDRVVLRGLALDPGARYPNAAEMANDLERAICVASSAHVSTWAHDLAHSRPSASGPASNPRWNELAPDSGFRMKDFSF